GFDPHRVGVDRLRVRCATCGDVTRREPYTLDTWYDSGCAPFAQYHYPFESGRFDPQAPLDFICEGLDQTRGWFYTMHVLATALFDRPAYRRVLVNGMVLDENGRKMSKSKGNAVDPLDLLGQVGGDALRWTFLAVDFTEPMRISPTIVQSIGVRFLRTLLNVAAFYLQNARTGAPGWDGRPPTPAGHSTVGSSPDGRRPARRSAGHLSAATPARRSGRSPGWSTTSRTGISDAPGPGSGARRRAPTAPTPSPPWARSSTVWPTFWHRSSRSRPNGSTRR
ncbi:Aminoacyl-tRNA synthetase, class Ia domain protein, partial [mine drainage metagenome]